ncbi:MAG: hypothetical protein R3F43_12025 [bacterium]
MRALKAQPGGHLYTGGVTLPTALARLGLIDEYELLVRPGSPATAPALPRPRADRPAYLPSRGRCRSATSPQAPA